VTGALFLNGSGPKSAHKLPHAAGEWFTMEVTVRGDRVEVKVNGITTAEGEYPKNSPQHPAKGFIALELNYKTETTVEFRKIEVMRLAK
jgi:3-keto-disaccharide hydrolase